MRNAASFPDVFLHKGFVDMRKAINGLGLIVTDQMKMNACDGALFVFMSKNRMLMKCLYWDRSGFAMWQKRLEKERFKWPKKLDGDTINISSEQMEWLLAGLDIVKAKPHETLHFDDFT
jgi:transposase